MNVPSCARSENHHIGVGLAAVLSEVLREVCWFLANVDSHICGGLDVGALARADQDVVVVEEVGGQVDERREVGDRTMESNDADFNCGHAKMNRARLVLFGLVPVESLQVVVAGRLKGSLKDGELAKVGL